MYFSQLLCFCSGGSAFALSHFFLVGMLASSFALAEWASRFFPVASFFLIPTRVWELLAGSLCALFFVRNERQENDYLAILGLALVGLSVFVYDDATPYPSLYALVPVAGAVLIILFSGPSTAVGRALSHRFIVGIGLISYSAYLWHQPLFAFARLQKFYHPSLALMLGLSALSLALAYLSWRFVEQPFRTPPSRGGCSRREVFALSGVGIVVFLSIGLVGHLANGFPQRFVHHEMQERYMATAIASPMREMCHASNRNVIEPGRACSFRPSAQSAVAVLGDSHGVELAYALSQHPDFEGFDVRQFTFSACGPSYGSGERTPCSKWTEKVIEYIRQDQRITHVAVTYRMQLALWGDHVADFPALSDYRSDEEREYTLQALKIILVELVNAHPNYPIRSSTLSIMLRILRGLCLGSSACGGRNGLSFSEATLLFRQV